ncbi:hypothetical protein BD0140_24200 [Helicobacter pylori]
MISFTILGCKISPGMKRQNLPDLIFHINSMAAFLPRENKSILQ